MKVIQVVPCINEEAQGPSYTVPRLCDALADEGAQVALHVLMPVPVKQSLAFLRYSYPVLPIFQKLGISPEMRKALEIAVKESDILHNHSLWMMPNIYAGTVVKGMQCQLITSPRGTLSEYALSRSRGLKKLVWGLGQSKALSRAKCIHATAESEYHDIRRVGLKAPVAIIPNGIDIPFYEAKPDNSDRMRRVLFLGRIDPKKRVDVLLNAWASVQDKFPDWELHISGPDNGGYLNQMKALAGLLGAKRVSFTGPLYGTEKNRAYYSSDLFVLPTHSENFGMAVAEALAHGVPAVVTKGAPWSGLESYGCGWWIEGGEGPLVECLNHVLALPNSELQTMGMLGRKWMDQEFSWRHVGNMMYQTYSWMLGNGPLPDWIILD